MADLSEEPVRVALVDDDPLVITGLRMLLAGDPWIEVVAELNDGEPVPDAVRDHRPDVILMDIRMPGVDGIEAVRRLAALTDPPPVIMLTTFDADQTVLAAIRAGAAGYLVKDAPPEQLVAAVHAAAAGDPVFSPAVLRALVRHTRRPAEPAEAPVPAPVKAAFEALGERERAIARGVTAGLSNADIAAELYLSAGTVKAAISGMLASLGLDNRIQLAILTHRLDTTDDQLP
ncbi:response regulator transcription factor [Microlunatus parietis]|uniref:DNA-binding NarL/FixJ family response regulator n=1 Tax=Microlunatus parietis TaxID=682979 RepID=A0A7Y9I7M0_9ACTN|nr:response regulator transcription factor [Microlunatus parietis]NYE71481.1 DNA-binding NarL/FixJ family response regulator [Microlunatus parietis]